MCPILNRKNSAQPILKDMSLLYITNSCSNSCVYCGFHRENPMARTILTIDQCEDEYKAIKQLGPFENLLIVTGENPAKAGPKYIADALDRAKPYFSNLKIEVMPLSTEDYEMLTHHGLDGVICFQETYNAANYKNYHPRGMKSRFEWRLDGFDRMGQAGVHSIGMGAGGYKFKDYMKAGLPLIVIATVISMIILPIAFPFFHGA